VTTPKFPLGSLVATPGALAVIAESGQTPLDFLSRHVRGDWGECGKEDAKLNDAAVKDGDRVFSAYLTLKGEKIWVITEADRSSTCILLPSEY
jgi:hypothetical protein